MEVAVTVGLGFYLAAFLSFDHHVSLKKSYDLSGPPNICKTGMGSIDWHSERVYGTSVCIAYVPEAIITHGGKLWKGKFWHLSS